MDATSKTPSPSAADSPRLVAWTLSAQMALILILTAALFYVLGRWSGEGRAPVAAQTAAALPRLDLNRATAAELHLLPGVGPALAQRIVEHRSEYGPFRRLDELADVPGVGPKTLERLRPALFVAGDAAGLVEPKRAAAKKTPRASKQAALTEPIDVNRAELAELQKLPGIGPKISQRIVDERILRGPFKTVEELRRVSGIGAKTLDKLRPLVRVEPPTATAEAPRAYNE